MTFYKNKATETKCIVKRIHLHHFLFKHMKDNEFKIARTGKFNISESANNTCSQRFTILADSSECNPLIIEYGNMVFAQFDVSPRYKDTLLLVRAYIEHKFAQMQEVSPPILKDFLVSKSSFLVYFLQFLSQMEHLDITGGAILLGSKNPFAPSRGIDFALLSSMGKDTSSMVRPCRPISATSRPMSAASRKGPERTSSNLAKGLKREDSEVTLPPKEALPCTPRVVYIRANNTQQKGTGTKKAVAPSSEFGDEESEFARKDIKEDVIRIQGRTKPFCNYKKFLKMEKSSLPVSSGKEGLIA
jgi:hypothetical protein